MRFENKHGIFGGMIMKMGVIESERPNPRP
jgi:hypothetical protein